jgi:hypothetical protein
MDTAFFAGSTFMLSCAKCDVGRVRTHTCTACFPRAAAAAEAAPPLALIDELHATARGKTISACITQA